MYSIRTNGDSIAQEFSKLLGSKLAIKKQALDDGTGLGSEVDDGTGLGSEADDMVSDAEDFLSDAALSDMIVDSAEDTVTDSAAMVDDVIDNLETFSSVDRSGQYIMNGLGKIAGSLRSKGEAFAADVVEATALSIRGDLVKEAKRKNNIVNTLNKMASDFSNEGDNFAADMVKVTINKLSY